MKRMVGILALALLMAVLAVGVASAAPEITSSRLRASAEPRNAVDTDGIWVHERRFQRIASANDSNRASGTAGYDASADYVARKLRAAGYEVSVQPFEFAFFRLIGAASFLRTDVDPAKEYRGGIDSTIIRYSGSGEVSDTPVVPTHDIQVPPGAAAGSSNSGCEPEDFPGEIAGKVALIQ